MLRLWSADGHQEADMNGLHIAGGTRAAVRRVSAGRTGIATLCLSAVVSVLISMASVFLVHRADQPMPATGEIRAGASVGAGTG